MYSEFMGSLIPRYAEVPWPSDLPTCPISASLQVLGRKWAIPVLRDIAFYRNPRFSDILRKNPGLTPRVLSFRLKEFEAEGFIRRRRTEDAREVAYDLLPKGHDAIPVLTALACFGAKHHAEQVFPNGGPRTMGQMFPRGRAILLQDLASWRPQNGATDASRRRKRPAP